MVGFLLGLNSSPESSGASKFGDVSEIGDFRQGQAENLAENLIFQKV